MATVQQQGEFIAAQPGHEIGILARPRQSAADMAQNLVARDMPKTIIDRLEVIHVQEGQADGTAV